MEFAVVTVVILTGDFRTYFLVSSQHMVISLVYHLAALPTTTEAAKTDLQIDAHFYSIE